MLVARDRDRLDAVATECAQRPGVDVEVLDADLTDPRDLARVEARLVAEPPVDLLVNNAGNARTGRFATLPVDDETAIVALNVTALMRLTHAAFGAMAHTGGGTVVNISSMAGLQPWPRMTTYAATKAFVNSFSRPCTRKPGAPGSPCRGAGRVRAYRSVRRDARTTADCPLDRSSTAFDLRPKEKSCGTVFSILRSDYRRSR